MNNFLKRDWYKISLVVLWNLAIVMILFVASSYFYDYQKNYFEKLNQEEEKNQSVPKNNENNNIAQEETFICPEDYDDPQKYTEGLASQMQKLKNENTNMTVEEFIKKRYQQLVDHHCEKTLFNISVSDFPETLTFMNKDFGPKATDVSKETKVKSIFYPLNGQSPETADEEIIINFFEQGVWAEKPFTTEDTVMNFINQQEKNGFTIENKYEDFNQNDNEPTYLLTATKLYPEEKYGAIYMFKDGTTENGDVYSLSYTINLNSEKNTLKTIVSNWLKKNNMQYLQAVNNMEFFVKNDNTNQEQIQEENPTLNNGIIELQQKEGPGSQ